MLISVRHLVERLRHPRRRADEVAGLRRALLGAGRGATAEERAAAQELLGLRREMVAAIGAVSACRGCARGHPPPHGFWPGGHCCGAPTEDLFNDDEIAALRLSGVTPGRLAPPPPSEQAGCAFRGPAGCSLGADERPNLCVRYVCPDLARELAGRGDLARIEAIGARMEGAYLRFITLRKDRLEDEELGYPPR